MPGLRLRYERTRLGPGATIARGVALAAAAERSGGISWRWATRRSRWFDESGMGWAPTSKAAIASCLLKPIRWRMTQAALRCCNEMAWLLLGERTQAIHAKKVDAQER